MASRVSALHHFRHHRATPSSVWTSTRRRSIDRPIDRAASFAFLSFSLSFRRSFRSALSVRVVGEAGHVSQSVASHSLPQSQYLCPVSQRRTRRRRSRRRGRTTPPLAIGAELNLSQISLFHPERLSLALPPSRVLEMCPPLRLFLLLFLASVGPDPKLQSWRLVYMLPSKPTVKASELLPIDMIRVIE